MGAAESCQGCCSLGDQRQTLEPNTAIWGPDGFHVHRKDNLDRAPRNETSLAEVLKQDKKLAQELENIASVSARGKEPQAPAAVRNKDSSRPSRSRGHSAASEAELKDPAGNLAQTAKHKAASEQSDKKVDDVALAQLTAMGFAAEQAAQALKTCGGDVAAATSLLLNADSGVLQQAVAESAQAASSSGQDHFTVPAAQIPAASSNSSLFQPDHSTVPAANPSANSESARGASSSLQDAPDSSQPTSSSWQNHAKAAEEPDTPGACSSKDVPASAQVPLPDHGFVPGAQIEAYWPDLDTWLPATLIQVEEDGSFSITWEEDGSYSQLPSDYVRLLAEPEPWSPPPTADPAPAAVVSAPPQRAAAQKPPTGVPPTETKKAATTPSLRVGFKLPNGSTKDLVFTRVPLGATFHQNSLVVASVKPNSHSDELGLKADWAVLHVEGQRVSGADAMNVLKGDRKSVV